jgi:hypothetical protein
MMDDSLLIFEPPIRNSGIVGGKFLERQRVYKPESEEIYTYQVTESAHLLQLQLLVGRFWGMLAVSVIHVSRVQLSQAVLAELLVRQGLPAAARMVVNVVACTLLLPTTDAVTRRIRYLMTLLCACTAGPVCWLQADCLQAHV